MKKEQNDRLKMLSELKRKLQREILIEEAAVKLEQDSLDLLLEENYNERLEDLKKINQAINRVINNKDEMNEWIPLDKDEYLRFRDRHADKNFDEKVRPLIENMPLSNGSRYYEKKRINIGIISDEFLFNSFSGVANFIYIQRNHFKSQKEKLDFILIASTWKGLYGEWKGLGNINKREHREDLIKIIRYYKKQNIKTVFYSKEDPVNYDVFIDIAKECDYVFTTAEECISNYKNDCKNEKVGVLSFGINPLYHNPVGVKNSPKRQEILFAGSWYNKYPERQKDTKMIFDGVIEASRRLKIIDRNFENKLEQYFFPKKYMEYISPAFHHHDLQKLHKLFDWSINLNSVKFSKTMFANRVLELQAIGNLLISNYNSGIHIHFPNVFLVQNKKEVQQILKGYSPEDLYKQQIRGIRRVMSGETTFDRIDQLMETIGYRKEKTIHKVAVVVKQKTELAQKMFNKQTYPFKELLLESDLNDHVKDQYSMIAFFDIDRDYKMFYLEDMVNGFKYTDSDYITKDFYYDGNILKKGIEHDYIDFVKDKYRTIFWSKNFTSDYLLNLTKPVQIPNGYSIDPFEFNNSSPTRSNNQNKEYLLTVIIPAFNNGNHLINKSFNSLRRSSIFENMEIIIVDDGSTDNFTPFIIEQLKEEYQNVKIYQFNDGGSGSKHRPRYKGVELSTTSYLTFLNPENESINDGYSQLLKKAMENNLDMVVGNMVMATNEIKNFNSHKLLQEVNSTGCLNDYQSNQLMLPLQPAIFKRELIERSQSELGVEEFGQNTDYVPGGILKLYKIKSINEDVLICYS
ncbi:glycosyltransferase [Sporosarcina globispora]|uniref:glycosyltransferase n=1 Tax=Sporosarcina globispora TaxID=1459 RepID=UPI0006A9908F|nr:glycosyltransferase [Sporosarcina globispora]